MSTAVISTNNNPLINVPKQNLQTEAQVLMFLTFDYQTSDNKYPKNPIKYFSCLIFKVFFCFLQFASAICMEWLKA